MKVQLVMIVLSILLSVSPCIALDQDTHEIPIATQWTLDAAGQLEEMQWRAFISFSVQNHPLKQCKLRLRKGRGSY